jgi:hypothetical protein
MGGFGVLIRKWRVSFICDVYARDIKAIFVSGSYPSTESIWPHVFEYCMRETARDEGMGTVQP